jgi:hypothetical protein
MSWLTQAWDQLLFAGRAQLDPWTWTLENFGTPEGQIQIGYTINTLNIFLSPPVPQTLSVYDQPIGPNLDVFVHVLFPALDRVGYPWLPCSVGEIQHWSGRKSSALHSAGIPLFLLVKPWNQHNLSTGGPSCQVVAKKTVAPDMEDCSTCFCRTKSCDTQPGVVFCDQHFWLWVRKPDVLKTWKKHWWMTINKAADNGHLSWIDPLKMGDTSIWK